MKFEYIHNGDQHYTINFRSSELIVILPPRGSWIYCSIVDGKIDWRSMQGSLNSKIHYSLHKNIIPSAVQNYVEKIFNNLAFT